MADGGIGEVQVRGYPVTPGLHKIERSQFFTAGRILRTYADLARMWLELMVARRRPAPSAAPRGEPL